MSNVPTPEEWQTALADMRRLQSDLNDMVARYCTAPGAVMLHLQLAEMAACKCLHQTLALKHPITS